ncbi:MAG: hypothetical protein RL329_3652 [Bacteroidota bacterium]
MTRSIFLMLVLTGFVSITKAQMECKMPNNILAFTEIKKPYFLTKTIIDAESPTPIAQKIKFWHIQDDNDAWVLQQSTDRYYTQGIFIQYFFAKNGLKNRFWNTLFFQVAPDADNYYGSSFRMAMYSPDTVQAQRDRNNQEHPYGGLMTLGMTCISKQPTTGAQLTTEYQLGVIGPAALQAELQNTAHQVGGKQMPKGWENQIPNDIALNVRLNYEYPLFDYGNSMEAIAIADLNAGTISNNGGIGFRLKVGHFHRMRQAGLPFMDLPSNPKFQYSLAIQPNIYFIGDNAMLQGGISLNQARRRQYIQVDNITRLVGDVALTYALSYSSWGLTYTYHVRTPEFKSGKSMFWGSVSVQKRF